MKGDIRKEEGRATDDEKSPIMKDSTKEDYSSSLSAMNKFDFARTRDIMVLILTLGVVIIVLYYSSCTNFGLGLKHKQVKENHYELKKVLEAAATKEKTVIITTLNDAWAEPNSVFDLFLESMRNGNNTAELVNHLMVVAVDQKAYIRCQKLVRHCYFFKTKKSSKMANEARFMSPIYMEMMWERLAFLQTILSLGYNFVFTDTDVMWFRNPFPNFRHDADFQTSCDHFNGREFDISNTPNNGFLFVRSNNRTIKFYKFWVSSRHTYPRLHEQDVFNRIKGSDFVRKLGVKLRFMDTNYFGGFCERSKDFNKVCTMHANCCVGLDNKIGDLKIILQDWKTYFSSSNHTTPQPTKWRAPKLCHM